MPARQKTKKQSRADAFRADEERQAARQRLVASHLWFWTACGHKKCLRARACAGDGRACYDRLWPLVPEDMKIALRSGVQAGLDGLSRAETVAAIERDLAHWREAKAPPAEQASPPTPPEPAPQMPPVVRAAPRAPGPRISVL